MNLSLADPFVLAQDYPDVLAHILHYGHSTCCTFNRKGDLLASGRLDGTVVLFDVETGALARVMRGHTRSIQSVSWSRDGKYLLSSSLDCKSILWDLQDGSRKRIIRFEAAVYIGDLHPFNIDQFVAAIYEDQPYLIDLTTTPTTKHPLPIQPRQPQTEEDNKKQTTTSTIFDSTGTYIITTTTRGWVNIIDSKTLTTIFSSRLSRSVLSTARLSLSGRELIFNSRDRILRTIHMPQISPEDYDNPEEILFEIQHTYQDLVNKLSWNHCDVSPNGEYICASTFNNHDVYVWETNHGSLVKILEGPKEELGFVEWHPTRPMIAAAGLETGKIFVWATNNPQRWSALAPDFQEVEENVEYIEHEDEFDYKDREEMTKRRLDKEDEEVDLITKDDERRDFGGSGWILPVLLDIEESSSDEDVKIVGPTAATSQKKKGRKKAEPSANAGGSGAGRKRKAADGD